MQKKDDELDFEPIFDFFGGCNLSKINDIVEKLYSQLHKELVKDGKISNGIISENIDRENSLIKKIFYFKKIIIEQNNNNNINNKNNNNNNKNNNNKNVKNNGLNEPKITKSISIDYKSIINSSEKKNLNLLDCFEYLKQTNLSYIIIPESEIITIIFDREENFKNNIPFILDMNYDMEFREILEVESRDKYKFKLIAFSSFYPKNKEYYSFYRNEDDKNKWYYFNGKESYEFIKEDYGIPVMLFYKRYDKNEI